jgi:iron complex transport system substrate-binding protein
MRIVSLLPSATEILYAIGLGEQVVGVTFECNFPDDARTKRIVSTSALPDGLDPAGIDAVVKQRVAAGEDLYHLDRGAFADLDPDIVVTQDLCAVCAIEVSDVTEALDYLGCRAAVVSLDPMTLDDVFASILDVGRATGTLDEADAVVAGCRRRLDVIAGTLAGAPPRTTLVVEWTSPAFTAGHWVPDLVTAAGGAPVLANPGRRSSGVEWSTVRAAGAEVVVVAPCGFGLDGAAALAAEAIAGDVLPPAAEVWAVDADAYIVRPGPRLVDGVEILASILHPGLVGVHDPTRARRVR